MNLNQFGKNLRNYRKNELQKTQVQLGEQLFIDDDTISRWERGQQKPSLDDIAKLMEVFGTQVTLNLLEVEHTLYVNTYNGVRWKVDIPDNLTQPQEDRIKLGIKVFTQLFKNNIGLDELMNELPFRNSSPTKLFASVQAAFRTNSLRILSIPRNKELESELYHHYPLKKVLVADIPGKNDGTPIRAEFVSWLAAQYVFGELQRAGRNDQGVGIGSGYTISRMVDIAFPSTMRFHGRTWIPLMALADERDDPHPYSANILVRRMIQRFNGSKALYLPYAYNYSDLDMQDSDAHYYRKVIAELHNCETIFISTNGKNRITRSGQSLLRSYVTADGTQFGLAADLYSDIEKDKAMLDEFVGEYLGLTLDKNALPLRNEKLIDNNKKAFSQVDLDIVKNISRIGHVWLLAARLYKAESTRMLIRNGLANSLVIDSEIAEYLIENAES